MRAPCICIKNLDFLTLKNSEMYIEILKNYIKNFQKNFCQSNNENLRLAKYFPIHSTY